MSVSDTSGARAILTMDSEYFYEKEAEYFGFTPFQFLDSVGEIVVKSVFSMFDKVGPEVLSKEATFLTRGQLEAVKPLDVLESVIF